MLPAPIEYGSWTSPTLPYKEKNGPGGEAIGDRVVNELLERPTRCVIRKDSSRGEARVETLSLILALERLQEIQDVNSALYPAQNLKR